MPTITVETANAATAVTVENILRQAEQLPHTEQRRLMYLLAERQAKPRKPQLDKRVPCEPMPDDTRERQWLEEHQHEYAGQWVALDGDRLIAAGPNRREIGAAAKADVAKLPLIHRIPAPDEPLPIGI